MSKRKKTSRVRDSCFLETLVFRKLKYSVTEVLKTDVFGDFWYSETLKNKSAYRDHSFRRLVVSGNPGFRRLKYPGTSGSGNPGFWRLLVPGDPGIPETSFFYAPPKHQASPIFGGGGAAARPMKRCAGCYNLCMTTCLQLYQREVNVHCFIICLSISKFTFNLTPEIQSTL